MKKFTVARKLAAIVLLAGAGNLWALTAAEQRHVNMLTQGGMASVKQAAQEMFNAGEKNPAVLDYLAEILLRQYASASPGEIDTLSWAAKALGQSGNPRYRDTLSEITNSSSTNKKLRKYAEKALDDLGDGQVPQYKRGGVSLKGAPAASKSSARKSSSTPRSSGRNQPLSAVQKGMSMAEAYDLVGEPTTSTGHITGKAWIPFNFRGADTARLYALYKGKGRIIFSNRSHYDHTWTVYEVQVDPNESGYP